MIQNSQDTKSIINTKETLRKKHKFFQNAQPKLHSHYKKLTKMIKNQMKMKEEEQQMETCNVFVSKNKFKGKNEWIKQNKVNKKVSKWRNEWVQCEWVLPEPF